MAVQVLDRFTATTGLDTVILLLVPANITNVSVLLSQQAAKKVSGRLLRNH